MHLRALKPGHDCIIQPSRFMFGMERILSLKKLEHLPLQQYSPQ